MNMTIIILALSAPNQDPKPAISTIRTFRGGQEGYVRIYPGGEVHEYVPPWRPNAAQQSRRYEAITNAWESLSCE